MTGDWREFTHLYFDQDGRLSFQIADGLAVECILYGPGGSPYYVDTDHKLVLQ